MPLYEYQCNACGKVSEVLQKVGDGPIAACPSCGGEVRKIMSSPAIQFKGSGFYITDYARSGGSNKAGESPSSSSTAPKAETKSESKSESKGGSGSSSE